MQFGDLNPVLNRIIQLLKSIQKSTQCTACAVEGETPLVLTMQCTIAGSGISVPAGLQSVAIVKTNSTGTVVVTLSSGTYTLTQQGEGITDAASTNSILPAYPISSSDGGTWQWHGIQTCPS